MKRIICLPPAGSGPAIFRPWKAFNSSELEVFPVPIPGRETRIGEPLIDNMDALVNLIGSELESKLDIPYVLVGYSMGGLLGYELIKYWQTKNLRLPEKLFLIASCGPDVRPNYETSDLSGPIHQLEETEFRQQMLKLGGTPKEILQNDEVMEIFGPIIRNDFKLCDDYTTGEKNRDPLVMDVHAFAALQDSLVPVEAVESWKNFSSLGFEMQTLDSEHMLSIQDMIGVFEVINSVWLVPNGRSNSAR